MKKKFGRRLGMVLAALLLVSLLPGGPFPGAGRGDL